MSKILEALRDHVLLADGATGTQIQKLGLTLADYDGHENCTEILNRTRPDVIRQVHESYFEVGADMVDANVFGASPITLAEFGLESEAFDLNRQAAILAHEAMDRFKGDGRTRYVLGGVGPGTKLPSLGHVGYAALEASYIVQMNGLIAGGVDAFLIETSQDPLQIKAAVNAAKIARAEAKADLPIFVQVTVETTGTMLVGSDIAAAATLMQALGVDSFGLNCATGPQEMGENIGWLAANWPGLISVQPNAGLPEVVDGKAVYPLGPESFANWHKRFVLEDGVNIVGGCCGTSPAHIAATHQMLVSLDPKRPQPKKRSHHWVPSLTSLYNQVPLLQENAFLSIGERLNANGSKQFRELQAAGDWDGITAMAKEQVKEGSHTLDVCTAFVGQDEKAAMCEVVSRLRGAVTAPLVIDSTEFPVLEAALELYGGKAVINSINFENGEPDAAKRLELARKHGSAVVALTIDEEGMAKEADAKLKIAHRLFDFAVNKHGLQASDLLFDPLTFTICTGNESDRKLAIETLDAIKRIRTELPECGVVLGLSNISFGLKPAARQVLNSVFLDHAMQAGMTAAIVHTSKILPLHKIPANEVAAAEALIFDRSPEALKEFIALFEDRQAVSVKKERPESVEERLKLRIIDGDRTGLDEDLAEALKSRNPLEIVNGILLEGMKVVGELFGSGKMQLPFVLQSAETMKAAVAYLEPFMEKKDGEAKATMVLATVKGDVHDIGKNLVDIILSNNGYKVINLGIKQPVNAIIEAVRQHKPDAVGMSGLLVKSTVIMKENLEAMKEAGIDLPVLLGGAALTRNFVETDCRKAYVQERVAYARDAFDGLELMARVAGGGFDDYVKANISHRPPKAAAKVEVQPVDQGDLAARKAQLAAEAAPPKPPFLGAKLIERVDPKALLPYLNKTMLYQFHWGFKKAGRTLDQWKAEVEAEAGPTLDRLLKICADENILSPQAAYGYFRARSEGNSIILFDDQNPELARFELPRQNQENGQCVADFIREDGTDIIALQVVTIGQKLTDVGHEWFETDRYRDYHALHGLGVEMAEALAEYVHKRIREELGFAHEDARDIDEMIKQNYRGSRYSFGYPACPNLADQRPLLKLLGAERIGVALTDEDQLTPEQSTSAIVLHHPKAKYFRV
jgi:5-methyltetrahydrofolate--homocysteine methyltransferase